MSATPEPKKPSDWQSQAYLDALRPDPGSEVRGAILTSYSADIASIAAALLALAGRDDDKGSGAKSDLAATKRTHMQRLFPERLKWQHASPHMLTFPYSSLPN
jgi:hypothetical protein